MRVCSQCGREATLFCGKCEANWCKDCSDQVHSIRAFQSHAPVAIPKDENQQQQQQPQLQSQAQQPFPPSQRGIVSPPFGAAAASAMTASLAGLSLEAAPASAHRWFSRSSRRPLSTAVSPRSPRPVLIVVDWHSFVWVVRRTSLGMFVRTLAHLAHDLGATTVTKLLFLMDPTPSHPEPSPRAKELVAEMAAFFIEQMQLGWETTNGVDAAHPSPLLAHKLQELIQRTDSFSDGSLTIFASSRPHRFRPLLDTWLQQGRQLALVHGQDKVPHSLPANALTGLRRPSDLNQLSSEVSTTMCAHSPPDPAVLSPYLDRTLTTALALICTTWPADSSSQPGSVALASTLGQHLSQLVGVHCVWDLPPWYESYEQPSSSESRLLPMHGCPLWNAGLPCGSSSGTSCTQPHQCQACSQAHPLTHCPVNSFLPVPSETFAKRSDISLTDRVAFMRWYGDAYALLKFHSSFGVWRLPLHDQLSRARLLILPSGVVQSSSSNIHSIDGLAPCDALIYIDWQNIKVPLYAVGSLMNGLRRFVLRDRPGVRSIRAIHVLLDRTKKSDIADALDQLSQTGGMSVPIHVEHVEARKVQAVDSRLTLMLRTQPRSAVAGHHQADLVCVVSGDSDFSPDMSRLVLLGHRVLVVYNAQARPSFKQNALWESGVDFMDLPELESYRAAQSQRRLERKHALHSAQQLGVTTRVSTMTVHGGDLQSRLPGISGACMDSEGHALLLTDEVQNQLWRFVLLANSSNAAMARLDMRTHRSAELKQMIKSARAEVAAGVFRDLHVGSLELLHASLHAPKEVVVDRDSGLVFVCEGDDGRVAVLDRHANRTRTLRPAAPTGLMQRAPHARHIFLDSKRQRLWLTDLHTHEMGYYDLRRRSVLDATQMTAPYRVAKFESPLPAASRPTSKCLAANQDDLVYCDEGRQAFFLLTEIKSQRGLAQPAFTKDAAATFRSTLLFDWTAQNSTALNSSAPLPSYHSLQLDRDGSYLFADATSHTIKRLVSLRDSDDADDETDSSHPSRWEVRLVAGKGQGGLANGEAREARFKFPATLVVDHSDPSNVFIVDRGNRLLRKLHVAHDSDASSGSGSASATNTSGAAPEWRPAAMRCAPVRSACVSVHRPNQGPTIGLSETARVRLKTRPCKPFQQGECHFQAESDKCAFIHECARCGGPHGERDCKHKQLQDQHPYLTVMGGGSSVPSAIGRSKSDPIYFCHICSVECGPLDAAVQHVESMAHKLKRAQLATSINDEGRPRNGVTTIPIHIPWWALSPGSLSTKVVDIPGSNDVDPAPNALATLVHRGTPSPDALSPVNLTPVNRTDNHSALSGAFGASRLDPMSSVASTVSLSSVSTRSLADSDSSMASSASVSAGSTCFSCDLCDMQFNSRLQMDQHEQGRMHRNRSARAAAGIPFVTPRCSPEPSPKRGEANQDFRCHSCHQEFQTDEVEGSADRRPRGLPCGHTVCLRCLQLIKDERCTLCASPFEFAKIGLNVYTIEQMQAHALSKVEAQRKRAESERLMKEQHDAFQRAYPCMKLEQRNHKEPRYFCEPCQIIAGPLHRALAHANTNEHKAKLQQRQQQQPTNLFAGWSPSAGTWPQPQPSQQQRQLHSQSSNVSPQFAPAISDLHPPPHPLGSSSQLSSAGTSPPSVFMGPSPSHSDVSFFGMQPQPAFNQPQFAATQLAATHLAATQLAATQLAATHPSVFISPTLLASYATPSRKHPVFIPATPSSPMILLQPDGTTFSGPEIAALDKRTHNSPVAKEAIEKARDVYGRRNSKHTHTTPPKRQS